MELLLDEDQGNGVHLLRLNRPDALNALNLPLRQALAERFAALAEDPSVRCVVLTGNARAFAAGADVKALAELSPMAVQQLNLHHYWKVIADFPRPLIAAVNGFALGGGCELALHADIIVAGESAKFGQPEIKLGIMPGAGGTQRLLRLVGTKRALRLLLTGEMIDAREAAAWGLVSEVTADDAVLERALAMAAGIAALSPNAVAHIRESVRLGQDMPLDAALTLERRAFNMLFDTRDQKEGMSAFLDKRRPEFSGE